MALFLTYDEYMLENKIKTLCPSAKLSIKCGIKGWRLVFRKFYSRAAVTLEKGNENDVVPVVVWDISHEDLDDMEIIYPEEIYTKKYFNLTSSELTVSAFTYVMGETPIAMPDEEYLDSIMEAYCEHNFDMTSVENALDFAADYLRKGRIENGSLYKGTDRESQQRKP